MLVFQVHFDSDVIVPIADDSRLLMHDDNLNEKSLQTREEASTFRTFAGNISLIKQTKPLLVILENVDMGDVSEEGSNGAMVHAALEDAGYANRSMK